MAIISKYPYDLIIQDADAWIGTDSSNNQTKQYTAQAVASYLNKNGKVSIGGQLSYKFYKEPYVITGSFSLPLGNGNGTLFSALTEVVISNKDLSNQDVVSYVNYLVGQEILISSQENVSFFGHYKIQSFTQSINFPDYYTLNLLFIGGNGTLSLESIFDFVNFTFGVDKTFDFTQAVPATTWNINHNLGKFPSITVIDTSNTVVVGEYTYIDNNNVTLTFSATFAGKAFLN